jgi:beta-aspartyl-peptidase (threonine type)
MIVIASQNGDVGIRQAVAALQAGKSVLDALEAGIWPVEDNLEDHWVGSSGMPSILGEVELDASIMNGADLTAGAVGCVKGFPHPISIARKVMETLPHVFLVGEGAERFAGEMGFPRAELLTPGTRATWLADLGTLTPHPEAVAGQNLVELVREFSNPRRTRGTVNFIARDERGNLATGVSTSGYYGKYPGRLGDSPVIGAGNYADNRYGAAACTGRGEMAMRLCTAHSVVLYLKMGMSFDAACREAVQDLGYLVDPYFGRVSLIAMDAHGSHGGYSNGSDQTYVYMTDTMESSIEVPRVFVDTGSGRRA